MSHGAPGTSPREDLSRRQRLPEDTPASFETRRHKRVYARLRAMATLQRMRVTRGLGAVEAVPHGDAPAVAQARAGVSNHEGARARCVAQRHQDFFAYLSCICLRNADAW